MNFAGILIEVGDETIEWKVYYKRKKERNYCLYICNKKIIKIYENLTEIDLGKMMWYINNIHEARIDNWWKRTKHQFNRRISQSETRKLDY